MKTTLLAVAVSLIFSGCSILGVGDTGEAACDGECNFKEAGVCADAISIYTNRTQLQNRKVMEHWFSENEDPYMDDSEGDTSFIRINEEELND